MFSGILPVARISADGEDSRFRDIRGSPPKFFCAFMIQATWVSLCLMPILAINALPASTFPALGTAVSITDLIGLLLYVGGLSFEVTADRQKSAFLCLPHRPSLPFNSAVCASPVPPPFIILISNSYKHLANSGFNSRYAALRATHPLAPKPNASFASLKLSLPASPRSSTRIHLSGLNSQAPG